MIPRYTRPEMASIWEPQTRFKIWFEIEAHAADAQAELGVIPKEAAKTIWAKAKNVDLRRRADRRDRARDQARRHRLPDPSGRNRRPRGALRPPGHDLLRRARHLPQRAAHPRRRPPDIRHRQGSGGAEEARLRAQDDADHRPLPRHPCRAGDVRAQARLCLCGIFPRPRAPRRRPQGSRDLRDFGRGRHLCADRPARRRTRRQGDGAGARANLDASHPARPPRDVFCDARRDRLLRRAAGDRNPPSAAHRGAGSRGILLRGPEGLVGDAAQAQPGAVGKSHRPVAHGARLCDAGDGKRRALARARHLALFGRAHDRAGRHRDARFRADAPRRV